MRDRKSLLASLGSPLSACARLSLAPPRGPPRHPRGLCRLPKAAAVLLSSFIVRLRRNDEPSLDARAYSAATSVDSAPSSASADLRTSPPHPSVLVALPTSLEAVMMNESPQIRQARFIYRTRRLRGGGRGRVGEPIRGQGREVARVRVRRGLLVHALGEPKLWVEPRRAGGCEVPDSPARPPSGQRCRTFFRQA